MIDVKKIVADKKEAIKKIVEKYPPDTIILSIIQVGDNPASNSYIKGKLKDCAEVGIIGDLHKLPEDIHPCEVLELIRLLNNDDDIKQREVEKEESKKFATPLLYEVTKNGSENKIYLFGSIHVADDRAYPMQDKIIEAYKNSDYLAVEFDLIKYEKDLQEQIDTMTLLAYADGSTIKDHMYEDSYNLMVNYLKENKMYNSLYDYYKPALFYSLISNVQAIKSELDAEKGIDMYFLEKAKKDKKEIIELESAMYQYNMLASFPDEMYDYMIKYSILNDEYLVESTKKLYEAWLAGNVDDIIMYSMGEDEFVEQGTYDEYENIEEQLSLYDDKLIYVRNREMTEKIDSYFVEKQEEVLIMNKKIVNYIIFILCIIVNMVVVHAETFNFNNGKLYYDSIVSAGINSMSNDINSGITILNGLTT